MAAILAAVLEALGLLSSVTTILGTIRGLLYGDQFQKDLVTAEEQIALMYGIMTNGTYGLPAIEAELAAMTPVTLPPTAPPGYGWDPTTAPADVWNYTGTFYGSNSAAQSLTMAAQFALRWAYNGGIQFTYNPLFLTTGWLAFVDGEQYPTFWPSVTTDSILKDDTVLSWLQREEPLWAWASWNGGPMIAANNPGDPNDPGAVCIFDPASFEGAKRNLGLYSTNSLPVWPGLANVILGTPVALSPALAITADMDGILVQSLTPSAPKPTTNFGGAPNYRAVGGLSFVNDDGEAEHVQALAFENQVYVPLTMAHASGVIFKCDSTVDATVTPWTLA